MHRDVCGEESGGKMSPQTPASPAPLSSPSSIGVNLRVTGHCSQGGRKYMEDFFSVAYHQSENAKDLEYAFVGIYDGHGGSEAATFAKEHLMMEIINQKLFWSDSDQDVLRAIREGYIATHYAMWREQEKWPKTTTGLPSTAGTTATVAFIRHEKIYIGHVGDSGIVLGYQNEDENFWRAKQLTEDHKPESLEEKTRIVNSGGKVVVKSGVPRVVWNRPRTGHKGPVRRSTPIDEIPFLAVARSLGDLWSYNSALNEFVVSPDPDVKVIKINPKTFRCLIFGTDGLWNVVSPGDAVDTVHEKEVMNERISRIRGENNTWCNPSKGLVERALKTWSAKKMRADNTSVVTVILYPPGAPSDSESSVNDCTSSYGLEYMQMTTDIYPNHYSHMSSHDSQQKFQSSAMVVPDPVYESSSYNQSHQLPHYDTIAPLPAMRLHLQQQQYNEEVYMASCMDRDESSYTNNYETHCDTNRYLYYEDQESNTYMNSFAESYNSLLASSMEREDSSRSNGSSSDNSNESLNSNPSEYHSYNSLNHTGLAGHDRVQHHCPNNEYHMEQQLYQEQCMSAEEGYSLTKLETRGEQKLRGNTSADCRLNSVQTFQIFGGETSSTNEYNQYNSISSSYKNSYHTSDNSNSNFLSSYEDDARCYEPNMSGPSCEEPLESSETSTTVCIERLDEHLEMDRPTTESQAERTTDVTEPNPCISPTLEKEDMDVVKVQNDAEIFANSIQIHEISSSVTEESPLSPKTEESQITPKKIVVQPSVSCENVMDSTPLKKPSIPKLVLYPNVPNENHRTSRGSSVQQYPRTFEKRMLRSMTVDYSKRTLRSRNSLSKEMKAKSTTSSTLRRSTIVQNKFIKAIQSSGHSENNTSVISRKSLNLRSRQITTTTAVWSDSPVSSSSSQRQRKSKQASFCDKSCASKGTPVRNVNGASSSGLLVTPAAKTRVTVGSNSPFSNHHLQQQIAISFAKRTNLRNSGWGSAKTTMQTRNRVQKRLGR